MVELHHRQAAETAAQRCAWQAADAEVPTGDGPSFP